MLAKWFTPRHLRGNCWALYLEPLPGLHRISGSSHILLFIFQLASVQTSKANCTPHLILKDVLTTITEIFFLPFRLKNTNNIFSRRKAIINWRNEVTFCRFKPNKDIKRKTQGQSSNGNTVAVSRHQTDPGNHFAWQVLRFKCGCLKVLCSQKGSENHIYKNK